MQMALDLNGSCVVNSVHYLHGYLYTQNGNNNGFVLNGSPKTALPQRSIIKKTEVHFTAYQSPYPRLKFRFHLNNDETINNDYDIARPDKFNTLNTEFRVVVPSAFLSVIFFPPVPKNVEIQILIELFHNFCDSYIWLLTQAETFLISTTLT